MTEILLDSSSWESPDDFFSALLPELGAPSWHGHNLDALYDSLSGGINLIEPPFSVSVRCVRELSDEMTAFLVQVATVFADARCDFGGELSFELI